MMQDLVRDISIKQVGASRRSACAIDVVQKEADHYQPYPNRNACMEQFV